VTPQRSEETAADALESGAGGLKATIDACSSELANMRIKLNALSRVFFRGYRDLAADILQATLLPDAPPNGSAVAPQRLPLKPQQEEKAQKVANRFDAFSADLLEMQGSLLQPPSLHRAAAEAVVQMEDLYADQLRLGDEEVTRVYKIIGLYGAGEV
jgi:hypothetical protein